jgi:hypothetical protein
MIENKQQRPVLIGGFLGSLRKRVHSPISGWTVMQPLLYSWLN